MDSQEILYSSEKQKFMNYVTGRGGIKSAYLSYVAIRSKSYNKYFLYTGKCVLNDFKKSNISIKTDDVIAERINLDNPEIEAIKFIDDVYAGEFVCGFDAISVERDGAYGYGTNLFDIDQGVLVRFLNLTPPLSIPSEHHSELSWQLRSLAEPYDGLNELLFELGLLGKDVNFRFQVISCSMAVFDFTSFVSKGIAHIKMRLFDSLDTQKACISFKESNKGIVLRRGIIYGKDFKWSNKEQFLFGETEIEVENASVLQCFASYDGHAQHSGWCGDPDNFQNPRRAIYDIVDNKNVYLNKLIFEQGRSGNARFMEIGIARLLWMLGFAIIHLGDTGNTQDFVDIIAITPTNKVILVECTAGPIKNDKIIKIADRRNTVMQKLIDAGYGQLIIEAMIVTDRSSNTTGTVRDALQKENVLLVAKEQIEAAMLSTMLVSNPDELITRLRASFPSGDEVI